MVTIAREVIAIPDRTRIDKRSVLILMVAVLSGMIIGILFQSFVGSDDSFLQPAKQVDYNSNDLQQDNRDATTMSLQTRIYEPESRQYADYVQELILDECALILIDVWVPKQEEVCVEQNQKEKLVPLLELARENGIKIIHANHGRDVSDALKPVEGEFELEASSDRDMLPMLIESLRENNIENLFYAGYATNMCVLNRPVGIINMSRRGYNTILLRDCTKAVETPESSEGEWARKMAVHMVECNWGSSSTLQELKNALEAIDKRASID